MIIFIFLGTESSWSYLFSLCGGLIIVALPTLWFVPESPKYLYTVRNEHSKALSGMIIKTLIIFIKEMLCLKFVIT